MWAKWTRFYNRAKSANADLSLFERAWRLCAYIFGATVLAWAIRTWDWYWNTFSWAGVAFAFLVSWIGIALAIFLSGLGMYLWRNEKSNARTGGNTREALACHPLIDISRSYLYFYLESWEAKIISTKSVSNVQVCVDFVADSGGVGPNFKRAKRRLVLRENVNFVLGAEVLIDLIGRDNGRNIWRWATNNAGEREPLVFICHSCQLVFIAAQEPPDSFDFIVDFHYEEKPLSRDGETPPRYEKTPSLIGEHRFLYAREWKSDGK